jgi:hypothetical protein
MPVQHQLSNSVLCVGPRLGPAGWEGYGKQSQGVNPEENEGKMRAASLPVGFKTNMPVDDVKRVVTLK